MKRARSSLLPVLRALSLLTLGGVWAVACGGPQQPGAAGSVCFRTDDCKDGLACVPTAVGASTSVCSMDLTGIVSMVDGAPIEAAAPAPDASGGSGGAASSAGASGMTAAAGSAGKAATGGAPGAAGSGAAGKSSGGAPAGGAPAGGAPAGGAPAGGAPSGGSGTAGSGTAGSATSGSGGTGGSPPADAGDG